LWYGALLAGALVFFVALAWALTEHALHQGVESSVAFSLRKQEDIETHILQIAAQHIERIIGRDPCERRVMFSKVFENGVNGGCYARCRSYRSYKRLFPAAHDEMKPFHD
jgi:hypothetical protein